MAVTWTLAEAASWLDPPVTEDQLRRLVVTLGIRPVRQPAPPGGWRHAGRPAKRYSAVEIMHLHSAVTPWLVAATRPPELKSLTPQIHWLTVDNVKHLTANQLRAWYDASSQPMLPGTKAAGAM